MIITNTPTASTNNTGQDNALTTGTSLPTFSRGAKVIFTAKDSKGIVTQLFQELNLNMRTDFYTACCNFARKYPMALNNLCRFVAATQKLPNDEATDWQRKFHGLGNSVTNFTLESVLQGMQGDTLLEFETVITNADVDEVSVISTAGTSRFTAIWQRANPLKYVQSFIKWIVASVKDCVSSLTPKKEPLSPEDEKLRIIINDLPAFEELKSTLNHKLTALQWTALRQTEIKENYAATLVLNQLAAKEDLEKFLDTMRKASPEGREIIATGLKKILQVAVISMPNPAFAEKFKALAETDVPQELDRPFPVDSFPVDSFPVDHNWW